MDQIFKDSRNTIHTWMIIMLQCRLKLVGINKNIKIKQPFKKDLVPQYGGDQKHLF